MNKTSQGVNNATQGEAAFLNQAGKSLLKLQIMSCKECKICLAVVVGSGGK